MRKMFSLIVLLAFFSFRAYGCEQKTISIPARASDLVFFGRDEDIPLDSCYWFSAEIGDVERPQRIEDAIDIIISSMPHWMLRAIQEGRGINECVVIVNNVDYFDVLIRAHVERWEHLGADMSKWKLAKDAGIPIEEHLQEMVCHKINKK